MYGADGACSMHMTCSDFGSARAFAVRLPIETDRPSYASSRITLLDVDITVQEFTRAPRYRLTSSIAHVDYPAVVFALKTLTPWRYIPSTRT
jgi:hypothetical protein